MPLATIVQLQQFIIVQLLIVKSWQGCSRSLVGVGVPVGHLTHPHTSPGSAPSLRSPAAEPEPQSCGSCRSLQTRETKQNKSSDQAMGVTKIYCMLFSLCSLSHESRVGYSLWRKKLAFYFICFATVPKSVLCCRHIIDKGASSQEITIAEYKQVWIDDCEIGHNIKKWPTT